MKTTPRSSTRAWFILAFCGIYLAIQLLLIVRGHLGPSKHFAFWMFPESTYFRASLGRVLIDGQEVATKKGAWTVEGDFGDVRYKWQSFVPTFRLDLLDVRVRSKGSFNDTLRYFQAALDYVAERIPEDKLTAQLVMKIRYNKAGGPEEFIELRSKPRLQGGKGETTEAIGVSPVTSSLSSVK